MDELNTLPGYLIRRLHQAAVSIFIETMSATGHDLTPVQYAALAATRRYPGLDQATLAGLIAHDRATIGGVVDRLAGKGLIERTVSPRDRRARELRLTPEGAALLSRLEPHIRAIQDDILSGLDPEERKAFVPLLRKAADRVNDRSRAPLKAPEP